MVPFAHAQEPQRSRSSQVTLGFLIALLVSLLMHSSAVVWGFWQGGSGTSSGENGVQGAGDKTIDVSIAGSPSATPAPASSESAAPAPTPAPVPTQAASAEPAPPPAPVASAPPPPEVVKPLAPLSQLLGGGPETSGGRKPGQEVVGGFQGLSPGSIEGQRALLPSAMTCKDPMAGRWEALRYDALRGDWVHFQLFVHSGAALHGSITSRTWSGGPLDSTPPACTEGSFDVTVQMFASGKAEGAHIDFGASSYTITAVRCPNNVFDYSPDHFSGTIDPKRQEFQSVNNDGGRDINQPYVFRRTGCVDE